jgi:RluA family pseudouridine synthase
MNLLDHLRKKLPNASMTTFRAMLAERRITIDGLPARTLKDPAPESANVRIIPPRKARTSVSASSSSTSTRNLKHAKQHDDLPFDIVHRDRDLIVINKPPRLLTSASPNDRRPTALGMLRVALGKSVDRVGLVHRLDMDASGLCVFSLNANAFTALKAQFADKSAQRTYHAIIDGHMNTDSGTIDNYLVELVNGSVRPTLDRKRGQRAITHWKKLATRGAISMLELRLETGRKHQLRAQLADMGRPIVGDVMYHRNPLDHQPMPGVPQNAPDARPRLMLAAVALGLIHPRTGKPLQLTIPTPKAFGDWWKPV